MEKNKEWLKKYVELNTESMYLDGGKHYLIKGDNLNELINQLEEPKEIELSEPSAWKTIAKLYHPNEVYWGNVRDSYIESLDEPEKVVIPQFVADFIEEIKPNFNIRAVFTLENDKYEQGQEWALDNPDVFARAWLDGYMVKEEPQWVVKTGKNWFFKNFESVGEYNYQAIGTGSIEEAKKFKDKLEAESVALLSDGEVEEITK